MYRVRLNGTYEYVDAEDELKAVEVAVKKYLGQLKDKPFVIQVEEVKQL